MSSTDSFADVRGKIFRIPDPTHPHLTVGYRTANRAFMPGAPSEGIDLTAANAAAWRAHQATCRARGIPIYRDLPMAINKNGACAKRGCWEQSNSTTLMETDEGMRSVIRCWCGYLMRPVE